MPRADDDAECDEPIAKQAEAAGEGVSFREVACVEGSCQAMFELAGQCSPAAEGPWYDCSLAEDVIRDRYAEDTELSSEDFGGGTATP